MLNIVTAFDIISIHALLAESDRFYQKARAGCKNFYPRSPCGERRWTKSKKCGFLKNFYPRSPCGERHCDTVRGFDRLPISIHALLAESDAILGIPNQVGTWISIHALLAESDPTPRCRQHLRGRFLSTLSLRRATSYSQHVTRPSGYFYPRSPCGERHMTLSCIPRMP